MLARQAPTEVPTFDYTLSPTPDVDPGGGRPVGRPEPGGGDTPVGVEDGRRRRRRHDLARLPQPPQHDQLHVAGRPRPPRRRRAPDPIPEKPRTYELTADPIEHAAYWELPVFWTSGTDHVPSGPVKLTLGVGTEVPTAVIRTPTASPTTGG